MIIRPQDGLTPLQTVKPPELSIALLESGADPNVQDSDGNTLLHLCESSEVMAALLKHMANPNSTNNVSRDKERWLSLTCDAHL